jgi:anti-sigma regulatory factor (Ser/Thr protein kinase)
MVNQAHFPFKVADRSYFAILKKDIHSLAASAGFTESKIGEIDIIVAEIVTNLIKHAGGGELLVKLIEDSGLQGIELLSIDSGPGMADVSRMVADGVSTKNTLGQGLGAMKRLSNFFQVYSIKNWGSIILVRIFEKKLPDRVRPPVASIKDVIIPKPGELQCGDGFYHKEDNNFIKLFLGDGLGHGPNAATAVQAAGAAFLQCSESEPVDIIRHIHRFVKKTRGLVGTVAVFNIKSKKWRICGVGNIATRVASSVSVRNYMSYNGIIGMNLPNTLSSQEIEHEKGQNLIMCSDGIKSRWDAIKYPSIMRYDLSILSAALLKDYARNNDDMSVTACKITL